MAFWGQKIKVLEVLILCAMKKKIKHITIYMHCILILAEILQNFQLETQKKAFE